VKVVVVHRLDLLQHLVVAVVEVIHPLLILVILVDVVVEEVVSLLHLVVVEMEVEQLVMVHQNQHHLEPS
tara:strand:- start:280 stop:489 length:210 start_codon:yes stop_codon:yes gene_type:complete